MLSTQLRDSRRSSIDSKWKDYAQHQDLSQNQNTLIDFHSHKHFPISQFREIFPIEFLGGLLKVGKHLHLQAIAASASQERLLKINLTLRSLSLEQPSYSPPSPSLHPGPIGNNPEKCSLLPHSFQAGRPSISLKQKRTCSAVRLVHCGEASCAVRV
ncbi:hypothetical protein CDAR_426851 [Caerostris darwini]|uniref:Uncharacterized protein n=1 Tax=Caerostris darwini TaxID=1538125 RepID=A0AAV4R9D9_9ARAC|nr:hypothetical protein CDAR_426851 [Caerostris darwini]